MFSRPESLHKGSCCAALAKGLCLRRVSVGPWW